MLSDEEKKAIEKVKYICDKWYDENLEIDVKWLESLLSLCEKQQKEIEKLKEENKEIRDWKYVIDNPIDLDKLKELDLIKIKGKEYISKSIYNELEKDKKALVNNYSNVLGEFIPKDKIKAKIEEYKKQQKEEPDAYLCIKVLQSLLEKE